jgi:ferredoxin
LAREKEFGLPISGIGGITNWRDAVEFILLGSSSVQVCTEVMLKGYRIVEDMIDGLENYMQEKGFATIDQMVGKAIPAFSEWGDLDLNYETVAKIDASKCIGCQVCVAACQAATSARSSAPSPAASPCSPSPTATNPPPGISTSTTASRCGRRRVRTKKDIHRRGRGERRGRQKRGRDGVSSSARLNMMS